MQNSNTQFNCHVHSIRKRLPDIDGISAKAAIDAICRDERTILKDDSPKYIKSIFYTQEQGQPEKTIITFTGVENE